MDFPRDNADQNAFGESAGCEVCIAGGSPSVNGCDVHRYSLYSVFNNCWCWLHECVCVCGWVDGYGRVGVGGCVGVYVRAYMCVV